MVGTAALPVRGARGQADLVCGSDDGVHEQRRSAILQRLDQVRVEAVCVTVKEGCHVTGRGTPHVLPREHSDPEQRLRT